MWWLTPSIHDIIGKSDKVSYFQYYIALKANEPVTISIVDKPIWCLEVSGCMWLAEGTFTDAIEVNELETIWLMLQQNQFILLFVESRSLRWCYTLSVSKYLPVFWRIFRVVPSLKNPFEGFSRLSPCCWSWSGQSAWSRQRMTYVSNKSTN
jgi:hypothetical protein